MTDYLKKIVQMRPVVQCITNIVTVNDCANALLAIGASPTMAHHPKEMGDFALLCDALVCNMGATENIDAMEIAVRVAARMGHPVVIDPVGCAGSMFRRKKCLDLIRAVRPSCIRGNASEIRALARNCNTGRGVDADVSAEEKDPKEEDVLWAVRRDVADLADQTGAIVVASGAVDVIGDGEQTVELHGGSAMMAKITGSGCMLSSILGAFLAAENSLKSAASACEFMNRCAQTAQKRTLEANGGTGTFHIALLDAMSMSAENI